MADVRIDLDEAAIAELGTSSDSPVADALSQVADVLHVEAVALAPVSAKGSRRAPPGFLKAHVVKADRDHDDDGSLARFVGVDGRADPVPFAFIDNSAGSTWNRGHKSRRSAVDYFLNRAVDATPFMTIKVG